MSTTTQFWATLGSIAAPLALRAFRIAYALQIVGQRIKDQGTALGQRIGDLDAHLSARLDELRRDVRDLQERERS